MCQGTPSFQSLLRDAVAMGMTRLERIALGGGDEAPLGLLWQGQWVIYIGKATRENSTQVSKKTNNTYHKESYHRIQQFHLWAFRLRRYIHFYVHCSIVYNT